LRRLLQGQVAKVSVRSVRGFGKKVFCRSASLTGAGNPFSSAINCCCCRQTTIISDAGGDFRAMAGKGSRIEKFTVKIKIQTAANPVQMRRQGQTSSRNKSLMVFVRTAATVNMRTGWFRRWTSAAAFITSWRMASSLGPIDRCRPNKISRGVFISHFSHAAAPRRQGATRNRLRLQSGGERATLQTLRESGGSLAIAPACGLRWL
jgi:hypothetical protein